MYLKKSSINTSKNIDKLKIIKSTILMKKLKYNVKFDN